MRLGYSISIATKMIFMVTSVVILAIGVVVYIATDLYREESVLRAQETNQEAAANLADRVFSHFQDVTSKMAVMAQFASGRETQDVKSNIESVLGQTEDMIGFSAYKVDEKLNLVPVATAFNSTLLAELKLNAESVTGALRDYVFEQQKKNPQQLIVLNTSFAFKAPVYSIALIGSQLGEMERKKVAAHPKIEPGVWIVRADFRQDTLMRYFSKQKRITAYVIDRNGRLLIHSSDEYRNSVISGQDLTAVDIVNVVKAEPHDNLQMEYENIDGEWVLGAYKRLGVGDLTVVAEISKRKALATIGKFQYRAFLVMIVVVCLAFIVNFLFSMSITQPLQNLFLATRKIIDGQFDVRLQVTSSDEVGALSKAFLKMALGLKERDKLKGAFDKFHSKEVAKKLLSGDIKLGGERKHATVFFSDIRGFTSLSEKMTPDHVVAMLNEYMTEMVRIIFKWNGVVDKYIGDAIMAVWGVPETHADDAYKALRAALEMREFLVSFNQKRRERGLAELKIGVGLHTGEVLAGNIGSEQRLEYTVIGDTVNQASRVEGANKPLHTDILITSATAAVINGKGIELGPPLKITAKGKSQALIVHKVIGYTNEAGGLVTIFSQTEIENIRNESIELEDSGEMKAAPAAAAPLPALSGASVPPQLVRVSSGLYWIQDYDIAPQLLGPFDVETIRLKVRQKQLSYNALAFLDGSSVGQPVATLPGLERRPMPQIQHELPPHPLQTAAESHEWYVASAGGETLGPYTVDELSFALERGNITRTTYVWNKTLPNWIYLYEVPGFERRVA